MGPVVFKTIEAGVPRLAGSIPVRLRHQGRCGAGLRSCDPRSRSQRPGLLPFFYREGALPASSLVERRSPGLKVDAGVPSPSGASPSIRPCPVWPARMHTRSYSRPGPSGWVPRCSLEAPLEHAILVPQGHGCSMVHSRASQGLTLVPDAHLSPRPPSYNTMRTGYWDLFNVALSIVVTGAPPHREPRHDQGISAAGAVPSCETKRIGNACMDLPGVHVEVRIAAGYDIRAFSSRAVRALRRRA